MKDESVQGHGKPACYNTKERKQEGGRNRKGDFVLIFRNPSRVRNQQQLGAPALRASERRKDGKEYDTDRPPLLWIPPLPQIHMRALVIMGLPNHDSHFLLRCCSTQVPVPPSKLSADGRTSEGEKALASCSHSRVGTDTKYMYVLEQCSGLSSTGLLN